MFTEQPRGIGGTNREVTEEGSGVAPSALRHFIGFSQQSLNGQSSGSVVCLLVCCFCIINCAGQEGRAVGQDPVEEVGSSYQRP